MTDDETDRLDGIFKKIWSNMDKREKAFKVGDRVACYGICNSINGELIPAKGVVTTILDPQDGRQMLGVEIRDAGHEANPPYRTTVHPKQCRRLKKKPRKTIWVLKADLADGEFLEAPALRDKDLFIKFKECK